MDRRTFVRASVGRLAVSASDRGRSEQLLGSWGLVSFEQVLASGEVLKPFGDSPSGLLLYEADGRMSAQVSVRSPARFANEDPLRVNTEEAAQAWRTYFGYWGSFKVDAENGVVLHRVEGGSFSNWIGTEQVRHFSFDGLGRLVLETPSPSGHFTLIWQRRAVEANGRTRR